jgi:hypothetical protein
MHCITCVHDCLHDAALNADVDLLVQIRNYTVITCVHDCLHDAALTADVDLLVQIRCYTVLPACMTVCMMQH